MLETITIEPKKTVDSCVIWLHGLGADGHDFEGIVPNLGLPDSHGIRFVFPHAPYRPITINMHMEMRAWYDIYTLDSLDNEDSTGIQQSCEQVNALIKQQNIKPERIVLAGFSQGGAIALYLGMTTTEPHAGIIALSTYLPFLHTPEKRPAIKHTALPILQCHGNYDDVIPARVGKETHDYLKTENTKSEWQEYNMGHQVCSEEIKTIGEWLTERLL